MFEIFNTDYAESPTTASPHPHQRNAENQTRRPDPATDVGSKQERKEWVEQFKAGEIDLLFVYNMLLTGFDAKRLKTLPRAGDQKAQPAPGADPRQPRPTTTSATAMWWTSPTSAGNFDATSKAYFEELQAELGDEMEHYSACSKSADEIRVKKSEHIKDVLFSF